FQSYSDRLAPSPLYAARISQATGRLWRSGIAFTVQTLDFFRSNGHGKVARTNLRHAAFQLVHQPADYLPWHFRRRIFSIDLPRPSIRSSGVSQQYRMVRAHDFPFWRRGVCSTPADRSLFNVGRHTLRRPLLYGSGSDRT